MTTIDETLTFSSFARGLLNSINGATEVARESAANDAHPAAGGGGGGRNHASKPDKYDGSRAHYETWRRSAELYVVAISSQRNKILAILSFLTEGDADQFARNYLATHQAAIDDGTVSWTDFLAALDAQFRDPREAEKAREALFRLKMGDQTALAFFLKVDELRVRGELTDPIAHDRLIVEYLERHMHSGLVLAVANAYEAKKKAKLEMLEILRDTGIMEDPDVYRNAAANANVPISYQNFRELAIQQDPHVRRFSGTPSNRAESDRTPRQNPFTQRSYPAPVYQASPVIPPRRAEPAPSTTTTTTTHSPPAAPTRGPDVVPMEVDRSRHKNNNCYTCGEPGHKSWACPKNPQRFNVREVDTDYLRRILEERDGQDVEEGEKQDF